MYCFWVCSENVTIWKKRYTNIYKLQTVAFGKVTAWEQQKPLAGVEAEPELKPEPIAASSITTQMPLYLHGYGVAQGVT